jgi:hypothetical protein
MKTNHILKEIRETRDKLSEEAGGDLRKLFAMIRKQEIASAKRGEVFVKAPPRPVVLREEPVPYRTKPAK